MSERITERELRDRSDEIMRALDRGESFVVTRDSMAVAELVPVRRRRFVGADSATAAFAGAAEIDFARFRDDIDTALDQDPARRG
jgi:antitoxin (DNA-binding transcriptional repressor) of toxin-antitoxin stability system